MTQLQELYSRYESVSDDEIRNHLKNIKIVQLTNRGIGTIQGYYPLEEKSMQKILKSPRRMSLTFNANEIGDIPIKNLVELQELTYLVKSNSRFLLKPDIGEIFDQIPTEILKEGKVKAILFNEDYELIDGTEGEHCLMNVTLLTDKKDKK